MWILSQDQDLLMDATCFAVQDCRVFAGTVVKTIPIGDYATGDRAMRILEMIYTHMKNHTGKKAFEMPMT